MPPKPTVKLNLEDELLLRIGAENSEHAIPWDILKNVGDKLEALILTLAKYTEDFPLPPDHYKLDFSGFYNGSAVPAFRLNSHPIPTLFDDKESKKSVQTEFSRIMNNVSTGNYQSIVDYYHVPAAKNEIIKKIYDFTNSAGNKPVAIVKRTKENKFKSIYSLRKLSKETFEQLLVNETSLETEILKIETPGVARILTKQGKSGRTTKKVQEVYNDKEAILSLKLEQININNTKYIFKHPVLFQIYQEGKGTIVENESLDLYAAGITPFQAKQELFLQFDQSYTRLTQLPDEQLGKRLLDVKRFYEMIVKSVLSI